MRSHPALTPSAIGSLQLENRLIRAATSESMADEEGAVTDRLIEFYSTLARGGAGLLITGHMFVEKRGRYKPRQSGMDDDTKVEGWRALTSEVHRHGGKVFCELSHAGSQTAVPGNQPVAPSTVPNAIFNIVPEELSSGAVLELVEAFGAAAERARCAGFDGVHIHGGNGYLISQFLSPLTNLREDEWGGSAAARGRFLRELYASVRRAVGPDFPISARLGMADIPPRGATLAESLELLQSLRMQGLNAVEPTYGIMNDYRVDSMRPYVGVTRRRALADWAIERLWEPQTPEAYYRHFAKDIKAIAPELPVILVGGVRTTDTMADVVRSGDADFLAMARPFIREPDLPLKIAAGREGLVACVSCNLCLKHEGTHGIRCWRKSTGLLLEHLWVSCTTKIFNKPRGLNE